jgi:2'-5' RNA ligase
MQNGNIRSFIAIDLPPEIRLAIVRVSTCLKTNLASQPLRWVDPDNIHLTLRFLGEISQAQLCNLVVVIRPLFRKFPYVNVTVSGLGAFPNTHKARVLWIGLEASPDLSQIINEMDVEINKMGIPWNEDKFSPHLTIGRVSRNATSADYNKIESVVSSTKVGIIGKYQVQSVNIYKSDLTPAGSVYTCFSSIPLH